MKVLKTYWKGINEFFSCTLFCFPIIPPDLPSLSLNWTIITDQNSILIALYMLVSPNIKLMERCILIEQMEIYFSILKLDTCTAATRKPKMSIRDFMMYKSGEIFRICGLFEAIYTCHSMTFSSHLRMALSFVKKD